MRIIHGRGHAAQDGCQAQDRRADADLDLHQRHETARQVGSIRMRSLLRGLAGFQRGPDHEEVQRAGGEHRQQQEQLCKQGQAIG